LIRPKLSEKNRSEVYEIYLNEPLEGELDLSEFTLEYYGFGLWY